MLTVRPRTHTLFVLALLLLALALFFMLLHADPVHAATDPNEPANNNVVSATHVAWWVQVENSMNSTLESSNRQV